MEALMILLLFVVLAVAAPRWGSDTHRSGEWGPDAPRDTWQRPDRRLRMHRRPHAPYRTRS